MTLNEIRNLNPKEMYRWPKIAKNMVLALIFIIICATAYWFDFSRQLNALSNAKTKENQLRQIFLIKKRQAVNLAAYQKQLESLKQSLGSFLKQLPNRAQMDQLLRSINHAGVNENLTFDLFRPGTESLHSFYAELPITIKVEGHYHEIGGFANDVAHLPRIVTLSNATISTQPNGHLIMQVTARTYRYLDTNELAQQKNKKGTIAGKDNK
ncbi:MAG: type 4a pilus biogenesis protein PilO [Proteobacteria bacterium]|nr:type 4a pilus biogenesis protein PilO [Pseudomonadota bacterium]